MRILLISPTPTHPTTAGNRARILSLVRALQSLGHEVHMALATVAMPDLAAMHALLGEGRLHVLRCRESYAIRGFLPRLRRKVLRAAGIEAAYLWGLDDYYDQRLTAQIGELCTRTAFDAACVEYVFMSKALEAVPAGVIKILDTHDRFALRHRSFLEAGQKPQWFSTTVAEEAAGLGRADFVLAIQDVEARAFRNELNGTDTEVITVGHLLEVQEQVQPDTSCSAVFLASGNPINVDAATYFIERVQPLVRQRRPDFVLKLAGDVANAVNDGGGAVVKLGHVPAVADAFRSAAVAVNPVRMGTGLNIKMLEALACGAACVSSQSGSRGLESYRNVAFTAVPDNDPDAMAQAVLSLLESPQQAKQLSDRAIEVAAQWNRQQLAALQGILAAH